ncbi:signal peptidase I, partial [bacterium]|nr:signal peptidase I [bacterium]
MSTKNIIKAFLIATVTALTVRLFIIEDYRISSDSMRPGLLKGDLILVSKAAFNLRFPFS